MLNNVPEITGMKSENKKFKVIFRIILQDYLYPQKEYLVIVAFPVPLPLNLDLSTPTP